MRCSGAFEDELDWDISIGINLRVASEIRWWWKDRSGE